MRLQQLQLIVALADAGSMRAAAQQLNVTQPALTKSLRQLEDEFAAPLVLRSSKGVQLTPAGWLVHARAASVLREIERAREEVAWETHRGHTRVSVGVSPAASSLLMPGALSHLHSRFPQVRPALIEALYPRSLAMVRSGEIEIAVGPLPLPRPDHDLATQVLFDGDTTMVVRSGSKYADARQIADLAEAPWVLTGPVDGPGDPRCLDYGDKMIASPTIVLECESIATLLAVLPSIDALALVPSGFHERYGQYAGLKKIDVAQALPKVTLHAAWRANVPLTIPAQALLDAFKHEALGYSK